MGATINDQAGFARLRAAVEACPFKSWAAFTDDSGPVPHTNLVSFAGQTDLVLSLPGRDRREPLVEFLSEVTPQAVADLLAERKALTEALQAIKALRIDKRADNIWSGLDRARKIADAALSKASGVRA